jgi:hypothetical protein
MDQSPGGVSQQRQQNGRLAIESKLDGSLCGGKVFSDHDNLKFKVIVFELP